MIVNNAEDYIRRCLDSFAPVFDELCIVRAIGNQKPDQTFEIAKATVAMQLKMAVPNIVDCNGAFLKLAEYRNKPGHEDWPHVDNFAAARQMSFDLATNDYCLWVDSDDVLKAGADKIRRHAETGGFACFIFNYDIFGKNVMVPRERMMLKSAGRWEHPVHECFKFRVEPVTAAMDEGVIIQHLPRLDKGERERASGGVGGNQRNLRILESIPPDQLTAGLKYHLFGELICAGRKGEAVDLAVKLLTETELGKDERYDLLMSLVLQTPDLARQVDLLHEAHKTDPLRREALGVLSCVMMDMRKPEESLAYARQMAATTAPDIQSWNSRQNFYGYTGDDIYQQALRVNGRLADAEVVRLESFKRHGGPRISLLHATRGRPEMASRCRKAWHDLAAKPGQVEHIFAIDEDDRESILLRRFHHILVPPGRGCVRAWNYAAASCRAPVLVQLSDDWIPPLKWDDLIIERLGDLSQPKVLAVSDGIRADKLLCMAICTRQYLGQDYFLFHPSFTGVHSDDWFTLQAYERGVVIEARDLVFKHNHPIAGAPMDKTYEEQNTPARYEEGQRVIKHLKHGNDWSTVPGWMNYWIFYEQMAEALPQDAAVAEVGVWFGRSIIFLAQTCKRLGKRVRFYAVDTFKGEQDQPEHKPTVDAHGGSIRAAFEENIRRCGVEDCITILEGDSPGMAPIIADGELDFCFIDAAHDYESVKADINAWLPKVRRSGTLAGHDALFEGVNKAVRELLPNARIIPPIWIHQK
jgi:methyltransferase family protein